MWTDRHTHTHTLIHTPDVDPKEVVEVKDIVTTNPHANVSDNNILEKQRGGGRERERERESVSERE